MAFERWRQQLFDLLFAVHIKRCHYDQASRACQLLLRPWPNKSQENEEAVQKDHQKKNEYEEKVVDHQEEEELKLVNDLLSKAQKTRVKIISKKLKEHTEQTHDELATVRSEKQLWECKTEPANEAEKNSNASHAPVQSAYPKPVPVIEPNDNVGQNIGRNVCSENATQGMPRKQHQKLQTVKEVGGQNSARSSGPAKKVQPSVSSMRKPALIPDIKRPKSHESAQMSQPHARPRSGLGKVKPAHITAPFKTDPNLHLPKHQARKPGPAVPQRNSGRSHIRSGDNKCQNKALPPISSVAERDQTPSCVPDTEVDAARPNTCDMHTSVIDEEARTRFEICSKHELNGELPGPEMPSLTSEHDRVKNISSKPNDARPVHMVNPRENPEGMQDTKLFSLQADGRSLNIPSKVRRAFAKNQQLRNKLLQRDTRRKVELEGCNRGQAFANKLQELFDTEEELLYRQQALECLNTHRSLAELLQHLDLDHLTDASSPHDILRAKVMAEFVLSSFSVYSEDASLLSKVQFPVTAPVTEPSHRLAGLHHVWLPQHFHGQDLCLPQSKLQYTSVAELQNYMGLFLSIQILQCQRHLLSVLINDIMPWLEKLDCSHDDFGAVFRGLFSLLVADGNHLPALINDSSG